MMEKQKTSTNNKNIAVKLLIIVVAGLAFGFAIAPLYDAVCKAIGLNGRADTIATVGTENLIVDESREITVIFTGTTMPGLDWSFAANENRVTVHPGEIKLTSYQAINNGSEAIVGSAVPSVTPEVAALYFKKIECFCFNKQTLQAGEVKDMPIRFFVSPDLPKDIKTVTLSYAFYKSNDKVE
jgi:cytochrome c oxidase assembly protein subunit 11